MKIKIAPCSSTLNRTFAKKTDMTYPEVVDFLYHRLPMFSRVGASAFKKDLTNITKLCDALGNPQRRFKSVHVGGTNGKGSVCHMLAAVFENCGYKTGLHTSPHLLDFRERFRVDGEMASKDFVIHFVEKNRQIIEEIQPSFFEISVAMAFCWFAENKVDMAIVEVGLGGRLDSTNILMPELSVITNISLEHTQFLGDTRAEIAGEKAGIIKRHTPVVIGQKDKETVPVFREKALKEQAPLYFAEGFYCAHRVQYSLSGQLVAVEDRKAETVSEYVLDLGGGYQIKNLQTVLCAVSILGTMGWQFPEEKVHAALKQVKKMTGLRGRWEILAEKPMVIADVGHNTAGIQQVMEQISQLSFGKLLIVTGFVRDKDVKSVMQFLPKQAEYFFCRADNPRAMPVEEVQNFAEAAGLTGSMYPSVTAAFDAAKRKAGADDLIMVSGSTFIVAEIL